MWFILLFVSVSSSVTLPNTPSADLSVTSPQKPTSTPSTFQVVKMCSAITNMSCGWEDAPIKYHVTKLTGKPRVTLRRPTPKKKQVPRAGATDKSAGLLFKLQIRPECRQGITEGSLAGVKSLTAIVPLYTSPYRVGIRSGQNEVNLVLMDSYYSEQVLRFRIAHYVDRTQFYAIDYYDGKQFRNCSIVEIDDAIHKTGWPILYDTIHWFDITWTITDVFLVYETDQRGYLKLICNLNTTGWTEWVPKIIGFGQRCNSSVRFTEIHTYVQPMPNDYGKKNIPLYDLNREYENM